MSVGNNVPAIRFEGFGGEWEEKKFKDIIANLSGGASISPNDYQNSGKRTIPKGAVNATGVADLSGSKNISIHFYQKNILSKVSSGDLVTSLRDLVPTAPNMGRVVKINAQEEDFLMPQGVYKIELEKGVDENFVITYSNSEVFRRIISREKNGSTQVHIRNGEFLDIEIIQPEFEEQIKIGNYFQQLDTLITQHQQKLDKLLKLKKALLEKMFPKQGATEPEIRFKGFSGEWQEKVLGDIGSVVMNKRIFKDQTSDNGDIPFFKIGTFGGQADAFISRGLFEEYKSKFPYPEKGDLLISASGSIGRTVEYLGEDQYFQDSNIVWLKHECEVKNSFLKVFYSIVKWSGLEGSTIKRLYNKNILETAISLPKIDEQTKIGKLFKNLDTLINQHQAQLKKLNNIKQACLEKMFV